jgi:hypothetical protein
MCIDYTNLNKHCPKDPFGLPRIDEVIYFIAGCKLLCFLDCYSGYHQITLKEADQIKTSFIMSFGAYCYMTMSFGLKNTGATYQRAISAASRTRSGRTSRPTSMMWWLSLRLPTPSSSTSPEFLKP